MIGDWMGSLYDVGGRRWDFHLFFDYDGRYERTVRREPDFEERDSGNWKYDEAEQVLELLPEQPEQSYAMGCSWRVLSVKTCEDSNVLLVLREIKLASRNLPILFYRVHRDGRAYGTNWENRLTDE